MLTITDTAVALRRVDYSETSQVIVFFTGEHGKVRAIWKGAKKSTKRRFGVGIDNLDVGDLQVRCRGERSSTLAIVAEWKQTRVFAGLREQLSRLYGAEYVGEITAHLTEDWDPHLGLLDGLIEALDGLAEASEPLEHVIRYQLRALRSVGSLPRFDACVSCDRTSDLTFFSSFEGGMICRHCESGHVEKREVSAKTLAGVTGEAESSSRVGVFGLLNYHISHLMGREPLLANKLVPKARRRIIE